MCLRAGLPIGYFASGVSLVGSAEYAGTALGESEGRCRLGCHTSGRRCSMCSPATPGRTP